MSTSNQVVVFVLLGYIAGQTWATHRQLDAVQDKILATETTRAEVVWRSEAALGASREATDTALALMATMRAGQQEAAIRDYVMAGWLSEINAQCWFMPESVRDLGVVALPRQ